ncbi:MAG: hypothetical protein PHI72_05180 [Atribacterota bacterium]|nr:hypothetical protein [Atribacterota bacterium]MDD4896249.1 hypothetical protein [Atribacterota bacterium]MDD5636978.1 hypothetical protein [Atribacterota bacterium]
MNWQSEILAIKSLTQAKKYITHIHVADSNRWAPGFGHLDFSEIVLTLKDIEYHDHISAEILPLPEQDAATEMTMKTLNGLNI